MSIRLSFRYAPIAACLLTVACGGGTPPDQASTTPQAAAADSRPMAEMGHSSVSGRVRFEGAVPPPRPVRMSSDPGCLPAGEGATSEALLVGADGGLQNVFVYVKSGLGDARFPVPSTPVLLDQDGCRYTPHVFGVQVGQPVSISNSDRTLHNVHTVPRANAGFNFGQPTGVPAVTRVFNEPEIMVPFKCDVHPWMSAYLGVVPHPFFAVSTADGGFEIAGLPAGTYTLEAWHEELGVQTMEVTVDGTSAAEAAFTFTPAS
jgi:plastocyanin